MLIHRILVKKYIGQSVLMWAACGVTMFAFAWVLVWVVGLVDMSQFQTVLEQLRKFERFSPVEFDALFTYSGRVALAYDEPIVILCLVIWCVSRGSDVVSGELGRGTLEMILAQPISRAKLMMSHAVVAIGGMGLLCLCIWGGIAVGVQFTSVHEQVESSHLTIPIIQWKIPLSGGEEITQTIPLSDRVDPNIYAAPTFHLFSFGYFLLGLSTLVSSMDRYRWRTIGTVIAIYVLQLIMFGLGRATEKLQWLLNWTFFSCYKPQKMVSIVQEDGLLAPWSLTGQSSDLTLAPLWYPLILVAFGTLFYGLAFRIFIRRDLPAPL